jgi:hypothetical protein
MAEMFQEKWMKGVAVTTTCLAVMTAIAASRGTACSSKTQLLTSVEGSKWAYYQAKSIKQNLAESQKNAFEVEMLGAANPEQKAVFENKLRTVTEDVSRYEQDKNDIKKEAEQVGIENGLLNTKGSRFSGAVVFFQIGIMLSSVAALLKRKSLWITGCFFGAIATVFLINGLILKPLLF